MAMADGAPPALRWSRLETTARRNGETPTRRSGHSLSIVGSSGYLFGGCDYSEPPGPTNDLFALKINANAPSEWERLRSPLGGAWPPPRWKHSATVVDNKIYVFGGFHSSSARFNDLWIFNPITLDWSQAGAPGTAVNSYGGTGYSRRDFDDLYMLRTDDLSWTKVTCKGKPPEKRAGHQACAVDDLMLFNDLHIFDSAVNSWTLVEGTHMASTLPRWNHACCAVFVFGGVVGEANNYNAQGNYMNDLSVLDTDFGPITGGTPLVIEGIDFVNKAVTIRFSCRKGSVDVPGEYVNDHTLNVVTPDFTAYPAGDIQIRVALQATFRLPMHPFVSRMAPCRALGLQQSTRECNIGLEQPLSDPTWTPEQVTAALIRLKEHVFMVEKRGEAISLSIEELRAEIAFLKDAGIIVTKELDILLAIEVAWGEVLKKVPAAIS
uniref:IPT/TIG domain-containing protein n=1 Tax=Phytophthora ramorum TaxID=164328 RepID=H3HB49_PHYRM